MAGFCEQVINQLYLGSNRNQDLPHDIARDVTSDIAREINGHAHSRGKPIGNLGDSRLGGEALAEADIIAVKTRA